MQARATVVEEEVVRAVALMEVAKEAAELVPNYKASTEFDAEFHELATDSILKGYEFCRSRVAELVPDMNLDELPSLPLHVGA